MGLGLEGLQHVGYGGHGRLVDAALAGTRCAEEQKQQQLHEARLVRVRARARARVKVRVRVRVKVRVRVRIIAR